MKKLSLYLLALFMVSTVYAYDIKGTVTDAKTGEVLIGATVYIKEFNKGTAAGLDGSFSLTDLAAGEHEIICSFVGYEKKVKSVAIPERDGELIVNFKLHPSKKLLEEIKVVGKANGTSDVGARILTRLSPCVVNIVSAKTIEVSPDITVANVIQRVPGVTVERNNSGDGQYAILRGMDKRYNYTLVNGIKIPSPDNKNRYIPLDIFPADMLDRLDVAKTLTPSMEGDAVGGVVNMVMKDAPGHALLSLNLGVGYSQRFWEQSFTGFDWWDIDKKTPFEKHGENSSYQASIADFTRKNLSLEKQHFVPNLNAGFTLGDRFFKRKLGVIVAGSFQQNYRGTDGIFFETAPPRNTPVGMISDMRDRYYTERQLRTGVLGKIDYSFNRHHHFNFSNVFVNLKNIQFRNEKTAGFSKGYDPDNLDGSETFRMRYTNQKIFSSFLQGNHEFNKRLKADWTVAYSRAKGETPDNAQISMSRITKDGELQEQQITFGNSPSITRRWEHNTDRDWSGYLNFDYRLLKYKKKTLDLIWGGLYRDKKRDNFFNEYTFNNAPNTPSVLVYGRDFSDFADMDLEVYNPQGAAANPLTYAAFERIGAGYVEFQLGLRNLRVIGGVRVEHTNQGYSVKYQSPIESLRIPDGNSTYTDVLPSVNVKYLITDEQNLRLSYFRSLNRPGFFEMVPYTVVNEDYTEKGNPDLKRATIDNADIRYEFYPNTIDQFTMGAFYKRIQNPIEYALQRPAGATTQDLFYMPGNFGTANNFGVEVDAVKYFRFIGFKANYTYTHSAIKTEKTVWIDKEQTIVKQKRPLYGQSAHVANLSLLYKNTNRRWDAQFALAYTGERISSVSQFLDNDIWEKGYLQGDFSMEKRFKSNIAIYLKANNLFDSEKKEYIKLGDPINERMPMQSPDDGETLISRAKYGRTFLIGIRFKL